MKVVLLHAFPLGPEMWAPQRGALEGHEVLTPNLYELEGNSIDGSSLAMSRAVATT